jgi:catechol 2,3-dioxygenase-like lactoylglutathione lyase family enzyme
VFTMGRIWCSRSSGFGVHDGPDLAFTIVRKMQAWLQNQDERRHRRDNEHFDAAAGVDGIETFFRQCVANGATILRPLTPTAWGTKDFYVEDPDGYTICFGGRPIAG